MKRHGVDCRIVDQKAEPTKTSNAIGVHARSLEMWDDMGIVDAAIAQGVQIKGLRLYTQKLEPLIHLNLNSLLKSIYPFALDLPQSQTEALLIAHLEKLGGHVERNMKVTALIQKENSIAITVKNAKGDHETINASYLIAADGYHSTVRELANIPYQGSDLNQQFIMIDAPLVWNLSQDEFHIFFYDHGSSIVFPMQNSCRTIIEVSDDSDFNVNEPLTRDVFKKLLEKRWNFKFELGHERWMSHFYIHERIAEHYQKNHLFLVGDAAHAHSPAGGQGMNTGMQDAYNLAWKLAGVLQHQLSPEILSTYEIERRPVAKTVVSSADKMTRIATLRTPLLCTLRNWAMRAFDKMDKLQEKFVDIISGIGYEYCHSSLSHDDIQRPLKAGMRAPTVIHGTKFVLLMSSDCADRTAIQLFIDKEKNQLIEVREIALDDRLHCAYHLEKSYCLIRPDQYIANQGNCEMHLRSYFKLNNNFSNNICAFT